jgi:hypothetical protein
MQDNIHYLVMEHIDGETLEKRLSGERQRSRERSST